MSQALVCSLCPSAELGGDFKHRSPCVPIIREYTPELEVCGLGGKLQEAVPAGVAQVEERGGMERSLLEVGNFLSQHARPDDVLSGYCTVSGIGAR